MPITLSQRLALAMSAVSLAVLTACGGGGGGAAADPGSAPAPPVVVVASASSVAVSGTITGFGSVILDGKKYDDTATAVSNANDPGAPASGALTDLKLGMHIDGLVKDGKLTDAVVTAAMTGPVGSIDSANASFTVYGQAVKVVTTGATPTVFDGVADLAALVVGDRVEVHGTLDATKAVNATRIERKPRTEANGVRLGGVVASLDTSAKTFKLGDMSIDYSVATLLPTGVTLANGQVFSAYSDTAPGVGGFKPKTIKVVKPDEGNGLELGGRIMAFTSVADFVVSGIRVDASAATFDGGVAADLATGVVVGAAGTVSNGVLKAKVLRVLKTPTDVAASLKGEVTEFVSAGSFKVRGTLVDASTAGVVFSGGSIADLGNGALLQVKGKVLGEALKAESVEFLAAPPNKVVTLKGELRLFNAALGTFQFLGASFKLGNGVTFSGGVLTALVNGRRVEVTGTPGENGVIVVTKVVFLPELGPTPSVLGGRVADLGASSFKLPGGITVNFSSTTAFEGGTAADLANGVALLAKGVVNGSTKVMTATWIEVQKVAVGGVLVTGTVGDFVSAADFRVSGQRIDASQAVFSDGAAADLSNGRAVIVAGSLVEQGGNKVVRAAKLRFLNK